jgi:hypothetical protein
MVAEEELHLAKRDAHRLDVAFDQGSVLRQRAVEEDRTLIRHDERGRQPLSADVEDPFSIRNGFTGAEYSGGSAARAAGDAIPKARAAARSAARGL